MNKNELIEAINATIIIIGESKVIAIVRINLAILSANHCSNITCFYFKNIQFLHRTNRSNSYFEVSLSDYGLSIDGLDIGSIQLLIYLVNHSPKRLLPPIGR